LELSVVQKGIERLWRRRKGLEDDSSMIAAQYAADLPSLLGAFMVEKLRFAVAAFGAHVTNVKIGILLRTGSCNFHRGRFLFLQLPLRRLWGRQYRFLRWTICFVLECRSLVPRANSSFPGFFVVSWLFPDRALLFRVLGAMTILSDWLLPSRFWY
jgi:hypothetical protein